MSGKSVPDYVSMIDPSLWPVDVAACLGIYRMSLQQGLVGEVEEDCSEGY